MRQVHTVGELREARDPSAPTAVAMTMGALHAGHAQVVADARAAVGPHGQVIVTIFVNPTQFGAGEDFERYPRSLDDDLGVAECAGADLVLVPSVEEVYGNDAGFAPDAVTVDPGPLGGVLEGASRPGHFRGMLTVVHKLLNLTAPDVALFGEKDYQQLVLIRRMVRDLSMPVAVQGVTTVREPDGLAVSSRNRYLSDRERRAARVLPESLAAVAEALAGGEDVLHGLAAGRAVVSWESDVVLDYLTVTDLELGPAPDQGPARALVAATVGSTRLIDNVPCRVGAP